MISRIHRRSELNQMPKASATDPRTTTKTSDFASGFRPKIVPSSGAQATSPSAGSSRRRSVSHRRAGNAATRGQGRRPVIGPKMAICVSGEGEEDAQPEPVTEHRDTVACMLVMTGALGRTGALAVIRVIGVALRARDARCAAVPRGPSLEASSKTSISRREGYSCDRYGRR